MGKKITNYKKWSFKFLIYIVLLNVVVAYLIATTPIGFGNSRETLGVRLMVLSVISIGLLIVGVILTILSVTNKEEKNYQYNVSVYGYPIYILINLVLSFL